MAGEGLASGWQWLQLACRADMRLARGWRAAADERLESDEAGAAAEAREARPACVRMCGMWRVAGVGGGRERSAGGGSVRAADMRGVWSDEVCRNCLITVLSSVDPTRSYQLLPTCKITV